MGCGQRTAREELQNELVRLNARWLDLTPPLRPTEMQSLMPTTSTFDVPACRHCEGVLKPDVVFFGENVPRNFVDTAAAHLKEADGMLIVGSSLMVYSGFRFVLMASRAGLPIAAVNLGRTRADDISTLKVEEACERALGFLL